MMTRTLRLTTPPQRGSDVRTLQAQLTNGPFGNFHPGGIDGEYGPLTAAAVYRAKYWLGYRKPDRAAGDLLRTLLSGGPKQLPKLNRARRAFRIKARNNKRVAEDFGRAAVAWARTQLGVHESPAGSNKQPYGKFWGENGVAWCGLFACMAWLKGGFKVSRTQALRWDYVPQLHADAIANNGVFLVGQSNVRTGDAVCLFNDGHVELFDHWIGAVGGAFRTVGGNTTAAGTKGGNPADGGHVSDPIRYWSDVSAAVRKAA